MSGDDRLHGLVHHLRHLQQLGPRLHEHAVIGHINVALVFGLLQFASTFLIAFLYARHAGKSLDPMADQLHEQFESETADDLR